MQTIDIPLSNPVASGATFTASYPTGKARKDYIQSGAILVVGQSTFTSPTVSLGASSITITNPTGRAIVAGTRVILSLNSPAENAGSASLGALARYAGHIEYPGSPVGNVVPDFVRQVCFDTTNSLWYRAYGTTSTSWRLDAQNAFDASGNPAGLAGTALVITPTQYIGLFGDSIAAEQSATGFTYARGSLIWAQAFGYCSFKHDATVNYGVAGNTTTQMIARIQTAITAMQAAGTAAVLISAGTNDTPNSIAPATTIANLKTIMQTFWNAGIVPILRTMPARSSASWGAYPQGLKETNRINDAMRAWVANKPRMFIHEAWNIYQDATSATSDPFTNYTRDGLHPTVLGGFVEGLLLIQELANWFQLTNAPRGVGAGLISHYDATSNINGNILNGGNQSDYSAMAGSNALSGTGYAGNWANGITPSKLAGTGTITGAKESATLLVGGVDVGRTYPRQVCTFSAMAGDETFQLRYNMAFDSTYRNWATGDHVYFEVEVEAVTVANLVGIKVLITEGWGSFLSVTGMDENARTEMLPTNSQKWLVRSPTITLSTYTSGGLIADIQIKANGGVAMSGTLKFGRPRMVKVPS